jgi:hypothetical protein
MVPCLGMYSGLMSALGHTTHSLLWGEHVPLVISVASSPRGSEVHNSGAKPALSCLVSQRSPAFLASLLKVAHAL